MKVDDRLYAVHDCGQIMTRSVAPETFASWPKPHQLSGYVTWCLVKKEQSLGTKTRCGKNATKHREHIDQADPVILSELQSGICSGLWNRVHSLLLGNYG